MTSRVLHSCHHFSKFADLCRAGAFAAGLFGATWQRCQDNQKVAIYFLNGFQDAVKVVKNSPMKTWSKCKAKIVVMGVALCNQHVNDYKKYNQVRCKELCLMSLNWKGKKLLILKWIECNWIFLCTMQLLFFFNLLLFTRKSIDPSLAAAVSPLRLLLGARCRTSTGWSGRQDVARPVSTVHRSQVCAWLQNFHGRLCPEKQTCKRFNSTGLLQGTFYHFLWGAMWVGLPSCLSACFRDAARLPPIGGWFPSPKRRQNVEMNSVEEVLW